MKRLAVLSAFFFSTFSASAAAVDSHTSQPNVLLILADDLGYSDTGAFGGEIDTPNIDALANNGVRFTQFYNTARCCPTRASLLTGLYPHQTGMGHMMFERNLPGYRGDLNRQCATLAEVLAPAGYSTYAIGKWHLTRHLNPDSSQHNWPLQRGFEKYYGLIWGYSSLFDPAITRGNTWYSRENDPEYKSDDFYFTDALTDNAIRFLQQHREESPGKPFFLYQAYTAAHWPMHARPEDIAKYKGRFDAGYDAVRQKRIARLRELGLLDPKWKPAATAHEWGDVQNREWELRCMEVYAAMIDRMDQGIGKIVAELKRQGQFENTIILFLQDNGGCAEDRGRKANEGPDPATLRPLRPDELPGGTIPKQTREGKPVKEGPIVMPGGPDTYIAYGPGWANVSNTPFREYKHWVHEGGIATPLIVHWPAGIAEERHNQLVREPGHVIDIMPTLVEASGAKYPAELNGERIKPMEGTSLLPLLTSGTIARKEPIYWEHEGNRAIRDGKWKLVAKENAPWELYDMEADRTEMNNLAEAEPERVRELSAKWDAWAARADVLPLGGWRPKEEREKMSVKPAPAAEVKLEQGQVLEGDKAPQVHGRGLTLTVELAEPKGDGVLVAHGGNRQGYALLVREGHLEFLVRREGELAKVRSDETLPSSGAVTVRAVLGPKGNARLYVNDQPVSGRQNLGLVQRTPAQALSAGVDSEDPVGDYPAPFAYGGKLGRITLSVAEVK